MLELCHECVFLQFISLLDSSNLLVNVLANDTHEALTFDHFVIYKASEGDFNVLSNRVDIQPALLLGFLEDI